MAKHQIKIRGFSLPELIISVAIIGILASIAYPSFVNSVRKSHRVDATSTLLAIQLVIEKRRVSNIDYANSLPVANPSGSYPSQNGFYTITYGPTTTAVFSVTAAPVSGTDQENDTCASFEINQNGPVINNAADRNCWGL